MDVNNLLRLAAENKASDLHLLCGELPIFRIDGGLIEVNRVVPDYESVVISPTDLDTAASTMLSKEQRTRFFEKRDLDLSYQLGEYRYRVNFSYEKNQIAIVARVISDQKFTLGELGLPAVIKDLLDLTQGLVLVTGPTGCGKSTTLAAMINHINSTKRCHIVTLEDPIEYVFTPDKSLIAQRQLGNDMLSFGSGLKHVLRQDPNVIMLGEMRDLETIATAVTLAETGHLVLATLHTYSASQTVDRIIDIFPPYQQGQIKSQLASVLAAVISQRLLPRVGGGRTAAREILINNEAVANLIREGKTAQIKSTIETGAATGMITLDRHIKQLFQAGEISRETALSHLSDQGLLDG